ncbi:MAG TPA: NAD(P)/FAD-dependent oxidoreductase [Steroidobacteraceae bacterium]|nr:NAD(P)/FAD-dependent oxidoreductase [Steroidobacteraceae bacterium]
MSNTYDVIVVGSRCAGSPTAMLLARKGYRVLLVDRARFPSDTISTHVVQPLAVAALRRWGLADALAATGCPPIDTYGFHFGTFTLAGTPGTADEPRAYCPRRIVLDKLLIDAAAAAGAEIREGFVVEEIVAEHGQVVGIRGRSKQGTRVTERAAVVVGADGRNSIVAAAVAAQKYNELPAQLAPYYMYCSGLPMAGRYETYMLRNRGLAAAPTHDGLTIVIVAWPYREFAANKHDLEGSVLRVLELAPEFAQRVRAAKRETPLFGMPTPNYFRKPYGPGWALVGDAGYIRDPITAQGIRDAFRDAEACALAMDQTFTGAAAYEVAMGHYQRTRDSSVMSMYEFTCQFAALQTPPVAMRQLFRAMRGNQQAMDGFARINAGTVSPAEFLAPDNIRAIMATASVRSNR